MSAHSSRVVCSCDAWLGQVHQGFPVQSQQRRRLLPSSFVLGLIVAGLITGLLTVAGAALIEQNPAIEEDPTIGENPSLRCTAFQVGSPYAANTHIHLENAGPEDTEIRFDFVDYDGLNPWAASYSRGMAPWASYDVVFRTPALGAAVRLISAGRNLHASTKIPRDEGAPPEIRSAVLCLARLVLPQATEVIP